MIGQILSWYLVIQVTTLASLPLGFRLFVNLPDRGYAFAKSLGILLTGFVFWWGYSFGLLRNDVGGAWFALLVTAALSFWLGWQVVVVSWQEKQLRISWRYVVFVESLFIIGFLLWVVVRAYDPAANHTEQPMDLMFMNSIWVSTDFPPRDAWLAGYAISYYYFGYWLLTMLARLAGQPPEVAYNLGQASWYGLLLIGSFGVGYNLLAWRPKECEDRDDERSPRHLPTMAVLGGLLAAAMVAVAGNGQVILEWFYANGLPIDRLAVWFSVHNFPANAAVTNDWFIGYDWWWWRSSRVIQDLDLLGNHVEVIDEFPIFSYILGDNHPHVIGMPIVLLVIGLAMNLFLRDWRMRIGDETSPLKRFAALVPMGWIGLLLLGISSGALFFLNTWDYPPYWVLLVVSAFVAAYATVASTGDGVAWRSGLVAAAATGIVLFFGALLLYLPYFLTAQSQAGGFLPNLFNPTRFPQFLLMFGTALLTTVALIVPAWSRVRPSWATVSISLLVVYGLPALFLMATLLASTTARGGAMLAQIALPPDASSHLASVVERWLAEPWTFLMVGGLLALVLALLWTGLVRLSAGEVLLSQATFFVLLLAGLGLLLAYAPEFVYLRDNFGTRMNTVFKFYYQAWLLFGLSGSYAIVQALRSKAVLNRGTRVVSALAAVAALILVVAGLIFPIAGAYSKTTGFRNAPTLDATAYVLNENPAELAAADWVRANTAPDALVLEGKGASYRANYNRISTMTGRPTLLGWDGHQSQWRGVAYGEMAAGRPEALETIYRSGSPNEVEQLLEEWGIDYVYIGPSERGQYGIVPASEERIAAVMELVFDEGDVRIYRRRG